jgi:tRNA-uridine 2-sulfurtransferase
MARVFAAMSGGVDSSVAAALLLEAGHDVEGVTMRLLQSSAGVDDARAVCETLGIPHRAVDLREEFLRDVVEPFCDEYAAGRTPNPCVLCNDAVKFGELWRRVLPLGADLLATGHYARIVRDEHGAPWLARGADAGKDQSYFLYRLTADQLERTAFPVGELTKREVRGMARKLGLGTASACESQDICFVDGSAAEFVALQRPSAGTGGPIMDGSGSVVGQHDGIARYTVGQRKGLGLAAGGPHFVTRIEPATNTVVVGPLASLEVRSVTCGDAVWRGGEGEVGVQVRYRQSPVAASAASAALEADGRLRLSFAAPVSGVAPGQAAVCYRGSVVVGGGVVEEAA